MGQSVAGQLSDRMQQINGQLLSVLGESTEEQLRWQQGLTSPSIGFHLWHISRWSDRNQALLAQLVDDDANAIEIWTSSKLAQTWGLDAAALGSGETGLGMTDDAASELNLPAKSTLVDYAERALGLLDQRIAAVDDGMLDRELTDANGRPSAVTALLLSHLTHASRHLGMIEALRGVQGQRGTASA